jgi:glycosyltransferase involved in cell wall biosynthesis
LPEPKYCIVIPHYNHHEQLAAMLPGLRDLGLPIIIVDDGSDSQSYAHVQHSCSNLEWAEVLRLEHNEGKGGAMIRGAWRASERDFTHMLQIDADGQHALESVAPMLALSRRAPADLISGLPVFSSDIPRSRLHGRKISLWWARIETLSTRIQDVMCGFRVYPLDSFLKLCSQSHMGLRMQFDIEIMVKMYWDGVELQFVPVSVSYPDEGLSHFRLLHDNVRISLMHTRLFFGMLLRAPALVLRNLREPKDINAGKF